MLVQTAEDLTSEEYELFRRLVYAQSGINLGDEKQQLVRARLGKRLREGEFDSYRAYYQHVKNDASGQELCTLLDAISTNTTHLFRENQHFDFLREALRQWAGDPTWRRAHSIVRIWSAGCSSGEEPHSIAMTVDDTLGRSAAPGRQSSIPYKILASDLSTCMLDRARAGLYELHRLGTVPQSYRHRYFRRVRRGDAAYVQITPELQRQITFARFNLMAERFPFRHGFHVIFCRNVMIYFDRATQEQLVNKFAGQLHPGGYLLIGHSESLNSLNHPLTYVQPTVYQKPANG